MIYLILFYEFFKIGLFAIGGGMATIPFLIEMAERTHWFTSAQLADMIAVSESTPGPIGVNMATYVGNNVTGILGGVIATLGLIMPSIIVILIIAKLFKQFDQNKYVKAIIYGLKPASIALISSAGIQVILLSMFHIDLFKATRAFWDLFNYKAIILGALIFIIYTKFKGHPIIYIAASAVIGIIFKFAA